jgi:hypothetical protein
MGQADPFALRCSVKGCREQEFLFWLAPCGMGRMWDECARGKKREERKAGPLFSSFFPFLPFLPSGTINPKRLVKNHRIIRKI